MKKTIIAFLICCMPAFYPLIDAQVHVTNVPDWFFKAENFNSNDYAVGISDPQENKTKAMNQAKIRALINYSLIHNAKSKSLTTLSMGNQFKNPTSMDNIGYIIYTNVFSGLVESPEQFEVADSFYNQNKEAIVLLKRSGKTIENPSRFSFVLTRKSAFQREHNKFPIVIDEMDYKFMKNDSVVDKFYLEKSGAKFFNTEKNRSIDFFNTNEMIRLNTYHPPGYTMGDAVDNHMLPCPLSSGLWNSYISNLIDQLCIQNNFEHNLQFRLSTTNLGNLNEDRKNENLVELMYSLKNVFTSDLKFNIEKIGMANNLLYIGLSGFNELDYRVSDNRISRKGMRNEKANLEKNKWLVYRQPELLQAWLDSKNLKRNAEYINSEIELQSFNLQSGIIEAVNLAKLELSSLMGSKITSVSNQSVSEGELVYLNSAKSTANNTTGKSGPCFIFYNKITNEAYNIRLVLYYKLNQ
ncbi:MAG: hypothetical protein U0W24_23435 [Bacteroidales bacterium]